MPATIMLPPRLTKAVKVLSKLCRSSVSLPAIAACILGQYLLPCQLKPLQSTCMHPACVGLWLACPQGLSASTTSAGLKQPDRQAEHARMPLQEFLQHGVYKLPHEALPDGAPRPAVDKFMRTMGREPPGVPYVITSKAPDIKSNDWRRVVAVFVSGQTWQFKDWPFKARSPLGSCPSRNGFLQASLHVHLCSRRCCCVCAMSERGQRSSSCFEARHASEQMVQYPPTDYGMYGNQSTACALPKRMLPMLSFGVL